MKAIFKEYEDGFSVEKCKERFDVGNIDKDNFAGGCGRQPGDG